MINKLCGFSVEVSHLGFLKIFHQSSMKLSKIFADILKIDETVFQSVSSKTSALFEIVSTLQKFQWIFAEVVKNLKQYRTTVLQMDKILASLTSEPWGKYSAVFNTYSMKTYVLSYFDNKNDVTIIVKPLKRAISCKRVALWSLIMIVTSFLCSKCNST